MEVCFNHGNGEAHYIGGIKQYFALNKPQQGLKHLKLSATNKYAKGDFLCAILLMCKGEQEKDMKYIDLHKWQTNNSERTRADKTIMRRKSYSNNMILMILLRSCKLNDLESRCSDCFYFKQNWRRPS
ncbi:hypothetical protein Bca4012_005381 [Brassica carinata]